MPERDAYPMLPVEEARDQALALVSAAARARPILDALGCVLAEDARRPGRAPLDNPAMTLCVRGADFAEPSAPGEGLRLRW